jgi:hypothetical protein
MAEKRCSKIHSAIQWSQMSTSNAKQQIEWLKQSIEELESLTATDEKEKDMIKGLTVGMQAVIESVATAVDDPKAAPLALAVTTLATVITDCFIRERERTTLFTKCSECNGTGTIGARRHLGAVHLPHTCDNCGANGNMLTDYGRKIKSILTGRASEI